MPAGDRSIVIEVIDNGIGIAPAALPGVTKAFTQVQGGLDRRHEGSGLGLNLAHRLMMLLDGSMEIESEVGAGTTVRLTLRNASVEASLVA